MTLRAVGDSLPLFWHTHLVLTVPDRHGKSISRERALGKIRACVEADFKIAGIGWSFDETAFDRLRAAEHMARALEAVMGERGADEVFPLVEAALQAWAEAKGRR